MKWFNALNKTKALSVTLVMATLVAGIVIGTLINTNVSAQRTDPFSDATPLKLPSPIELKNDFTELVKRMEPAVVNITATYENKQPQRTARGQRNPYPGDEELEQDPSDLFRRFGFSIPGGPQAPQPRRGGGTGSGFIVDPKGYIITNNHVVDEATKLEVTLHGVSEKYRAKLIGVDPETDIAVIKIDVGHPLPFVPVGNSDAVQVGDWAIAIGSPFGLDASVTAGIVSAKGRSKSDVGQATQFQSFIQTDAAINPGNSGGPLLNIQGQVIGVNTMIATQSGGYQGIGFALPVNTAVKVYNDITRHGKVTRGAIGIEFNSGPKEQELLQAFGLDRGVVVKRVTPGKPADKAGIKEDDVIIALNSKPIKNGEDLVARVAETPVGDKMLVSLDRGGKKMDLSLIIGNRDEVINSEVSMNRPDPGQSVDAPAGVKFGIGVSPLGEAKRAELKIQGPGGVLVTNVVDDSFAEEVGLEMGDIITEINRTAVASVDDIRKVQSTLKPGDAVAFKVTRPIPAGRGGAARAVTEYLSGKLPR
jgi:serine protease Do